MAYDFLAANDHFTPTLLKFAREQDDLLTIAKTRRGLDTTGSISVGCRSTNRTVREATDALKNMYHYTKKEYIY